MKIFYDDQIFSLQEYGGISRYHFELIRYFQKKSIDSVELSTIISNNKYLRELEFNSKIQFFPNIKNKKKDRLIYLINRNFSLQCLKKHLFDIFHPTFYDPYFLKILRGKEYVITIHDMIHEKFPEYFSINDKTSKRKNLIAKKAKKIIAVSQNTKEDIIQYYNIPDNKITVIYHGLSLKNDQREKISEPEDKYVLFVGNRGRYKNFSFLASCFPDIIKKTGEIKFICAGGGKFTKEEKELFKILNIEYLISQVEVDDNRLSDLYRNASLFIFPSLYEGFGMPILEAFEFNCPVLCSDIAASREIAQEGACYFELGNKESLMQTACNILVDADLRKTLIQKGRKRVSEFSWSKCGEQTYDVYNKISIL